jgi:hypothetical protein
MNSVRRELLLQRPSADGTPSASPRKGGAFIFG